MNRLGVRKGIDKSIILTLNRQIATKVQSRNKPVLMSYVSYESTQTQSGSEPSPLLIMHGLFGSKANWNTLSKEFQKKTIPQRKIIAVDARNHGDSPHSKDHSYKDLAEDLKFFLTTLKIKKVSLIGHSMGGRAVMTFALQYPHLVDKLILVDISPFHNILQLKTVPSLLTSMLKVVISKKVTLSSARLSADMQLSRSVNDKALRSFLLSNLVRKSDGGYAWRINIPAIINNFSKHILKFPEISSTFDAPVLFILGELSGSVPESDRVLILKMFPKAEFKTIEGAGHYVHSEKPKEFLHICLDYLNTKPTTV